MANIEDEEVEDVKLEQTEPPKRKTIATIKVAVQSVCANTLAVSYVIMLCFCQECVGDQLLLKLNNLKMRCCSFRSEK